ncbi:hypothetical protein BV22DRAFT_1116227 [Leucogyrophana mollusca]|uniref:Uncharacterized protein n=1 Tax=Leucogyrophana mollusca TaxID=85980 RepID=A0ACB8BYH0_9AGAM|nr:hypothetical protein BV22DRAFT_1116227 [Leucogyrophana mollusca]
MARTYTQQQYNQVPSIPARRFPHPSELDPTWQERPIIDFTHPQPDDESTVRFSIAEEITGRIMPHRSSYTLEFLNSDGTRVKDAPDLQVFDVTESTPVLIPTVGQNIGPRYTSQFYYIHPRRKYEVYYRDVRKKRISFPPTILVE